MIVDDEPVIKKGIVCFVDWKLLGCTVVCEASNGLEAIEKLDKNEIDILITDIRMPGMDGLALSKYVSENYPGIKVIILTAYADFSYAQSAIKYNVVDFIIKTNPSDKIAEAVMKARSLIERQKEKSDSLIHLKGMINKNLSAIRGKFFNDVFSGIIYNPEEIANKIDEYGIVLDSYHILSFEISSLSEESPYSGNHDQTRLIDSIKNFLSLAFKDYKHNLFMMNRDLLIALVSFNEISPASFLESLVLTCNDILKMVGSFMKFTLNIGISGMHSSFRDLQKTYNESLEALMGNFASNENLFIYKADGSGLTGNSSIDTYGYIDGMANSLKHGSCDEASSALKMLFGEYKDKNRPVEEFKVSGILIYSLCSRLLENYMLDPSERIEGNAGIYRQIHESRSLQGLYNILLRLLEATSAFITSKEMHYSGLVKEANKYIRNNYHDDVDLQSIADFVHVSSSYLCRLYKKETGESIIDALNRFRIDTAKKLLTNPGTKIYEVAISVGIRDQSYFTYVFKKYAGVSPKEYVSQLAYSG